MVYPAEYREHALEPTELSLLLAEGRRPPIGVADKLDTAHGADTLLRRVFPTPPNLPPGQPSLAFGRTRFAGYPAPGGESTECNRGAPNPELARVTNSKVVCW